MWISAALTLVAQSPTQSQATPPAPQSDGKIHRYTIANPVPDGVAVKDSSHTVTISNRATGGKTVELDKRKDYTFTVDAQRVATMELTPAGLTKLAASRKNNPDTVVSVSLPQQ